LPPVEETHAGLIFSLVGHYIASLTARFHRASDQSVMPKTRVFNFVESNRCLSCYQCELSLLVFIYLQNNRTFSVSGKKEQRNQWFETVSFSRWTKTLSVRGASRERQWQSKGRDRDVSFRQRGSLVQQQT